jgi:hypothetical protein
MSHSLVVTLTPLPDLEGDHTAHGLIRLRSPKPDTLPGPPPWCREL